MRIVGTSAKRTKGSKRWFVWRYAVVSNEQSLVIGFFVHRISRFPTAARRTVYSEDSKTVFSIYGTRSKCKTVDIDFTVSVCGGVVGRSRRLLSSIIILSSR